DPALDIGTPTHGGGDLDIFYRLIRDGGTLVFEPAAIVKHRGPRDYAELRTQISRNAIGYTSFLTRNAAAFPWDRFCLLNAAFSWLGARFRQFLACSISRRSPSRDLAIVEILGAFVGLGRYHKSLASASQISAENAEQTRFPAIQAPDRGWSTQSSVESLA